MIDREAWLAALRASRPQDDQSAITIREFMEVVGLGQTAAQRRMRRLIQSGKAITAVRTINDVNGRPQVIRAYRLLKDGEA